ncbi:terminase [Mucilaginibacter mali]|uniref:Terminase n=1 Tax=Mucilaginibacter mali TaxID=2740462 RepID=A0A7D4Q7Y8_9SPHI|nr:terminase large subunit [Mucilaginibacter mali]QKJ28484.1 terminase [Mucilaginibacter mali]
MQSTILFSQNYNTTANVVVNQGGTSSGKTYAIEQVLFVLACSEKVVITIVGQDIPNLKVGALRDAMEIYRTSPALQKMVKNYNRTDRVFEFTNGSLMEFNSYSDAQDAKSGKRDYLFINEANGISWDVYIELALRTRKRVYIDYNPNTAFWVHDKLLGGDDVQLIISDHRHNPFLDDDMHRRIEGLREQNEELWKVYARGLTGKVAGLVLSNWYLCNEIPRHARRLALGLDFGFTNDQTGCLEVFMLEGELWLNELFYETGLTNPDISNRLSNSSVSKKTPIIADSAEPKSIEELRRMGWNISGAIKGPDSVNLSIDILKRYRLNITRNSVNLVNELSRYKWRTDRNGRTLNEPVDAFNHLIDPLRYVALNKLRVQTVKQSRSRMPWMDRNFGARDYDWVFNAT